MSDPSDDTDGGADDAPSGDDDAMKPGSSLEATGSGFFPDETVHVTLGPEGLVLGSFVVDEGATFAGSFTVPADLGSGTQVFTFTGETSGRPTTVPIVIDDGSSSATVPGTEGTTTSDTSANTRTAGVRAARATELARTGVDGDQLRGMLALAAILGACGRAFRTRTRRSATED